MAILDRDSRPPVEEDAVARARSGHIVACTVQGDVVCSDDDVAIMILCEGGVLRYDEGARGPRDGGRDNGDSESHHQHHGQSGFGCLSASNDHCLSTTERSRKLWQRSSASKRAAAAL